jgi:hypothetical protein
MPLQQRRVDYPQLGLNYLREKNIQSLDYQSFFSLPIAIPVNHLMGKSLAATTDTIANASRTNADTRCFDPVIEITHTLPKLLMSAAPLAGTKTCLPRGLNAGYSIRLKSTTKCH